MLILAIMEKQHVLIIGGGISGLYTALQLSAGCEVTLLEGSNRLGGRILDTHRPGFDEVVKEGAEFVHGNATMSFSLLRKAGARFREVEGKMYRFRDQSLIPAEEMVTGWDELLEKMGSVPQDQPLGAFLNEHFGDPAHEELNTEARRYAEGFDVADPERVSIKALYREWSAGEQTFQIEPGYGKLVAYLESACQQKGIRIITDAIVKQLTWSPGSVTAFTLDGRSYRAQRAVITVPVSALQPNNPNSILFSPSINEYTEAARNIGFGAVIKAAVAFREPVWKPDDAFFLGDQPFPTWWTQHPFSSNVLTGWAGGTRASALSAHPETVLRDMAMLSIAALFGQPLNKLRLNIKAIHITNWQQQPCFAGAYSYPTPETSAARSQMNKPVAGTLFFAGEALYEGEFSGTVEAALLSAEEVVKKVTATGC